MCEHLPDADVLGQSLGRLVPGLSHDVAFVRSVHGGLGYAASTKRVTAQWPGLHSRPPRRLLQNPADRGAIQNARTDAALTVDRAEQGTGLNSRFLQPAAHCANRTCRGIRPERKSDLSAARLLISLGTAHVDNQAVLRTGDVGDLDRRKFGPTKGAGQPDENQRPIARTGKTLRTMRNDFANIGGEQWLLAMLRCADRAANSFQCFAHDEVMRRRLRILGAS